MNQALTLVLAVGLAAAACRTPEPGYSAEDLPPLTPEHEETEYDAVGSDPTPQAGAEPVPSVEPEPVPAEGGWKVVVSPYLFGAGLRGAIGIEGADGEVNADFSDLLGELDFGGGINVELAPPDSSLGLLLGLTYVGLEEDGRTTAPGFDSVDAELDQTVVEASLVLELQPDGLVDLLLGARYWDLEGDLKAIATPPGDDVAASRGASWVEPLIGVRSRIPLSESLSLLLRGDAGGFGLGSEYTYDLGGQLAWAFSRSFELALGYRLLYAKYDDDFLYDASNAGPVLGLNWTL
jgi:hypothetical protein